MKPTEVLISGAGIAGPTLAYWLHRYGYAVTVAEKAGAPRDGGYPIDIRGTAIEVVRRMGILPRLQDAHIDTRRYTFLNSHGDKVTSVPSAEAGGVLSPDLEVRRGDLAAVLYALVRDDVEFLFNDSVHTLVQRGGRVDVTLRSGRQRTYDLVVGADGMHSHTRGAVFGTEEVFHRYLGYCFALFTMPNTFGLSRELMMWNTAGKAAALYAAGDHADVHAFLTFHQPRPPLDALRTPAAQRELVAAAFFGEGWEIRSLVDAMGDATDLFFDLAGQIRMPCWSSGRVALVGDAAYAPSLLTGQGSSLALVGAYMLAHALAANHDPRSAFAAYERDVRGFVGANQDLVDEGAASLFPTTVRALEQRNAMLRGLVTMPAATARPAHSALTLPAVQRGPGPSGRR